MSVNLNSSCFLNGNNCPSLCDYPNLSAIEKGDRYAFHLRHTKMEDLFNLSLLSIGQAPLMFIRVVLRIYGIFTGDWHEAGKIQGTLQHERNLWEWSIKKQENPDYSIPQPNDSDLQKAIQKRQMVQLAKNIGKAVLCIFAIIALEFVAIFGVITALISPDYAKRMWGNIEYYIMRDEVEWSKSKWLRISDCIAVCMQSKEVGQQLNLFRTWRNHNPQKAVCQWLNLTNYIKEHKDLFEKEKIDMIKLNQYLDTLYQNIKRDPYFYGSNPDNENPQNAEKITVISMDLKKIQTARLSHSISDIPQIISHLNSYTS